MPDSDNPYPGPTVTQWCETRILQINNLIEDLTEERELLKRRAERYRGSKMSEAERRATAAEPFQAVPLPLS